MVVGAEHFGMPAQERGGMAAKIYGDIKDLARQAADEFGLGVRGILEVEAPHRAPAGCEGMVDLDNVLAGNELMQFFIAEQPIEIAPAVSDRLAFQEP